ncbi:MAG: YgiT-type zinc finger protein [Chloroflexota bacterium]
MALETDDLMGNIMRCTVCGGRLEATVTDLLFKVRESSIVIIESLPVLACGSCPEYLIEDAVMHRVDQILARADSSAELEIVRFAA